MNSELPDGMRLLVAANEANRSLTRNEWLAIFYKYNGDAYKGYPEEKWSSMVNDPLGYLAYWSGPHATEIAKDVWDLLLPRMSVCITKTSEECLTHSWMNGVLKNEPTSNIQVKLSKAKTSGMFLMI